MYIFFTKYGFVFELLLSFFLFTFKLEKRRFYWLRISLAIVAIFLYAFLRNLIPKYNAATESLKYVALYFLCFCLLIFIFKSGARKLLFCTVGASLAQHVSYRTGDMARSLLNLPTLFGGFVYAVIIVLVNILFWLLLARQIDKDENLEFLTSKPMLILSGAMLLVCVLFQQLFDQYGAEVSSALRITFSLFDIMSCFFVVVLQYEVIRREHLNRDYHMLEHILRLQKEQMQESKQTIDLINIKCHDLKKQIVLLGDRNNITKEEIEELNRAITIYDASVKTGNEALDVLLAEKTLFCSEKGIQFNCIADGKCLSFMRSSDIYSLFGNAIDNAIEAVSKIKEKDLRCVGITIKDSKNMILAHFENYYEGALAFEEGLPITTKGDKQYHGYGMKSIKMLVEKYSGWLSVIGKDGVFNLDILIPISKEKPI